MFNDSYFKEEKEFDLEELLAAINYLEEQPFATNEEKYNILVDIIVTKYLGGKENV